MVRCASESTRNAIGDACGWTCAYCGQRGWIVDHVWPVAEGGPHIRANMVMACKACNSAKGRRFTVEWLTMGFMALVLRGESLEWSKALMAAKEAVEPQRPAWAATRPPAPPKRLRAPVAPRVPSSAPAAPQALPACLRCRRPFQKPKEIVGACLCGHCRLAVARQANRARRFRATR